MQIPKIQKHETRMSFTFKIIIIELVAVTSFYYYKNTRTRQSTF